MNRFVSVLAFACIWLSACTNRTSRNWEAAVHDPQQFRLTVRKLNDVVLENNFPPMVAARNYVYASIAAYEIIAATDSAYRSLSGQIRHLPAMPRPEPGKPVDGPLAAMLAFTQVGNAVTFPEGSLMDYHAQLLKMADSTGMPSAMLENTQAYADAVSRAILEWSKGDRYAPTRSAPKYTVVREPGRWIPTPPMYAQAVEPHWGEIRPMILDSATECRAVAPPQPDINNRKGEFFRALMEVKNSVDSLQEEGKHIADFWDDNPFKLNVSGHVMFATKKFSPAGHWMNIVGIASEKAAADFSTTVYAYAKTAIALFDGFIGCWYEKYHYNYVRPETVINQLVDDEWRPYIQTPPFPSYPSGHSVISAAAAEAMTDVFGENLAFTDTSLLEFGIRSRDIRSFREAALEASISRLYGGIHYRFDLDNGNDQGKKIGEALRRKITWKRRP